MKSFFSVFALLFIGSTVAFVLDPLHRRNPRCLLPYSKGIGHLPQVRIYYDKSVNRCVEFVYNGWGGNENRFSTKKECTNACKIHTLKTTPKPSRKPHTLPLIIHTIPSKTVATTEQPNATTPDSGSHDATCHLPLPPALNWPPSTKTAYAYDASAKQCFYVYYDEATLNANNFPTREACMAYCSAAPPTEQPAPSDDTVCSLPPPPTKEWPKDSKIGFWYDQKNGQCEPIYYDEATKNGNNFNSVEECLKACSHNPNPSTPEPHDVETTTPEVHHESTTESNLNDPTIPFVPTSKPDKTERDRICNLPAPPNRDWNDHTHTGYHYDAKTEECDLVYYDEETKNENLFQSLDECLDFCLPEETTGDSPTGEPATDTTPVPESTLPPTQPTSTKPPKLGRKEVLKFKECSLQPFAGYCKARLYNSYFFNITTMKCQRYTYGGCGATANHYSSEEACEKSCIYRVKLPLNPKPQLSDKCTIPLMDGRCAPRSHKGYVYDHEHHTCEFKTLHRCLRSAALHKTRSECLNACAFN